MKKLLEQTHPVGKLPAGTVVRGLIKEIHPPAASSEDKQHIVLSWPSGEDAGVELGCNLMGEHIHLDPDKCGKVITITGNKVGALYLSKFENNTKAFLTIREGVAYEFRDPAPGSVPTVSSRIDLLADHYVLCMEAAHRAIEGSAFELDPTEVQKLSMSLFLDTKHQAKPVAKVPTTEPKMLPAGEGSQHIAPASEPAEPEPATPDQVKKCMDMPKDILSEKTATALVYDGEEPMRLQWREAFVKATTSVASSTPTDSTDMPIWRDVLNHCHNMAADPVKEYIDAAINHAEEAYPEKTASEKDRAVCLLVPSLIKEHG